MSGSTPATPPAHALKKIINTIKCSLKSLIKGSHLEAVQWGNRMQTATASRSPETTPKAAAELVTLSEHFQNPEGPFPWSSQNLLLQEARGALSWGSQTHRHVLSTPRQPLGQIKTIPGSSSPFEWVYFFPGKGRQGDRSSAQAAASSWGRPQHSYSILDFFKLQCTRVHIPE